MNHREHGTNPLSVIRSRFSVEIVPKPSISLVGHGFSRAKTLAIIYLAILKVNPMEGMIGISLFYNLK